MVVVFVLGVSTFLIGESFNCNGDSTPPFSAPPVNLSSGRFTRIGLDFITEEGSGTRGGATWLRVWVLEVIWEKREVMEETREAGISARGSPQLRGEERGEAIVRVVVVARSCCFCWVVVVLMLSVALLGTQSVETGLSSKRSSYVMHVEVAVVRYAADFKYFIIEQLSSFPTSSS